ncbi:nitroreductase family protein [Clostridiisalibacter paucivorans]|uniref:nitroreductase family protein n=1 Tax=Clostridiisalibacter paucivorans TaxID=408753 RepID=UPI00047D3E0B|nr:nitroreductase family protein [Clostridiisalibacter paucivorans]
MLDILKKRRSIRKFKTEKVEREKIDKLMKAALLSPSSKNKKPWEFIIITDESILEKLSKAKEHGGLFLKGAPLGIVILGDEEKSDVWVEDTSIASILIQMEAESIGLGSCWIQIRERQHGLGKTAEEYIQQILNVPKNKRIECIIAVGYPDEQKSPHTEEELRFDKVYMNKYRI